MMRLFFFVCHFQYNWKWVLMGDGITRLEKKTHITANFQHKTTFVRSEQLYQ